MLAVLLACVALMMAGRLHAQPTVDYEQFPPQPLPDTPAALVPAYGFNDDEFSVGAYMALLGRNDSIATLWELARSLGIRIIEWRDEIQWSRHFDTLANEARGRDPVTGRWLEGFIPSSTPWAQLGWGRQITLFPFDSSESWYWPCLFLHRVGGRDAFNPWMRDHNGQPVRERVFDAATATPGATVLGAMVMGYDSLRQKYRFTPPPDPWTNNDSAQHAGDVFYERNDLDLSGRTLYMVVTGHLFKPGSDGFTGPIAEAGESLVDVEIWNEVPRGSTFLAEDGKVRAAAADTTFLYTTLSVPKSTLAPRPGDTSYAALRSVSLPVDMIRPASGGPGGPWNAANSEHRFDVRVRWTGREMLAIRSVAIRDTALQLLHGTRSDDSAFRARLDHIVEYVLRGPLPGATEQWRVDSTVAPRTEKIIRFYSGDEGHYTRNAGFTYLDTMLFHRYPAPWLTAADSLARGVRAWRAQNGRNPQQYVMTSQSEICVENYPHLNDVRFGYGTDTNGLHRKFDLPAHINTTPTLREHNGGRFWIPLLNLTGDRERDLDTVETYARSWNRMSIGANIVGHVRQPYDDLVLSRLGPAGWASRRTGRRLIQWVGSFSTMFVHWITTTPAGRDTLYRDTIFSHMIEGAELRGLINLGLCYGSRGIHYAYLGGSYQEYSQPVPLGNGTFGRNYLSYFTPLGPHANDTDETLEQVRLESSPDLGPPTQRDTIRGIWTGRGSRQREMAWLDTAWLPSIGRQLRRLRWRDAYSIHYTAPQPYIARYAPRTATSRPIAPGEPVRALNAVDRNGRPDPAENTFVELGLFDVLPGRDAHGNHDPAADSTFIMLANRRTFERPADIPAASPRGAYLDSLAETRTLVVQLGTLPGIGTPSETFVRVRELAADTTPLPLSGGVPRRALDTVIRADAAFAITLRPGGAALLEITRSVALGSNDTAGGKPASALAVQAQPNPAQGRVMMIVRLPEPGPMELRLFDAAGRMVGALARWNHLAAGSYSIPVSLGGIPAGAYTVELASNGGRASEPLIVVH